MSESDEIGDASSTDGPARGEESGPSPTRVAIACQGGGSHTAFTCGVLRRLLEDWDDANDELVGISGTSGGAFNALAMWYGLLTGDPQKARSILAGIWDDMAVDGPQDWWLNGWVTGLSRLESAGFAVPSISPSQIPIPEVGKQRISSVLERYVDFEEIPSLCTRDAPELVVGTVNVNEGYFETFRNEDVTVEAVLASAAVPNLFEAVEIHGHYHWDGLFSQNPPVSDLFDLPPDRKPEELWVVQVNPQRFEGEPTTSEVIADRRNALSGNISLNQELRFIERVNDWVETGKLPADEFQHTAVRRIEMGKRFPCSTKVDRSPAFLDELRALGQQRAAEFLDRRQ